MLTRKQRKKLEGMDYEYIISNVGGTYRFELFYKDDGLRDIVITARTYETLKKKMTKYIKNLKKVYD